MNVSTRDATRYEITAMKDGREYLVAYSPRKSRSGLLQAMQGVGNAIIEVCKVTDDHEIKFSCQPRVHATVNGWIIGFTGRTQREIGTLNDEKTFIEVIAS